METASFSNLSSPCSFTFTPVFGGNENISSASSPFVSAPSSPGRYGSTEFCFSTPPSPGVAPMLEMRDTREELSDGLPFSWGERPGTPKRGKADEEDATSCSVASSEFEFSATFSEMEEPPLSPTPMSSAENLAFHSEARPLRPPPRLQQLLTAKQAHLDADLADSTKGKPLELQSSPNSNVSAPQSPRSPLKQGQLNFIKGALCGISDPVATELDPFSIAMEEMAKSDPSRAHHRRTRSLSPLRILHWDEQPSKFSEREELVLRRDLSLDGKESTKDSKRSSPKAPKRWTFKDLLHRSWSEGRSHSRETSRGLADPSPREKLSSRRGRSDGSRHSTEGSAHEKQAARGKVDESSKARGSAAAPWSSTKNSHQKSPKGAVSPHELHYMMQKAQSEEMRRKTFLPYRQGLLGCLGFTSRNYRSVSNISKAMQPVS